MTAEEIIAALNLQPHPEGGHYRETFRDDNGELRAASTAIYYLLRKGERSHWHRIDAVEVWHYYAGGPLLLKISPDGVEVNERLLGPNITAGQTPQIVIPRHAWQYAMPHGDWTLVGCTVAPGFEFSAFEMAPEDWSPAEPD
jgi:predicted cupin superfamily sugar epimerase